MRSRSKATAPLTVLCWKWDAGMHPKKNLRFEAQHVNTLYRMVKRHLHMDYQFACITDDVHGLRPEIRTIPMWPDLNDTPGCFRRLKVFSHEMRDLIGPRFVSIDLDCVVVSDITPLFDRTEDFVVWGDEERRHKYCGGMFMMNAGARAHVWDNFRMADYKPKPSGRYPGGTDQIVINTVLENEATWSRDHGVYNFKLTFEAVEGIRSKFRARQLEQYRRDIADKIRKHYNELEKRNRAHTKAMVRAIELELRKVDPTLRIVRDPDAVKEQEEKRRRKVDESQIEGDIKLVCEGKLPENARIIFFNGRYDPSDTDLQNRYPWIKEHWQ